MKSWLWRHKTVLVIWILVFGMVGYAGYVLFLKSGKGENPYLLSNNTSSQQETTPEKTEEKPKQTEVELGQAATNGDFEFTVSKVVCNETSIGDNAYAKDDAEGVFCRASIKAKNISTETKSLPVSLMKLIDNQDGGLNTFDSAATMYAQADVNAAPWHESIPAGQTKVGDIIFDIPTGASPRMLMISGAEDSGSLTINL